MLISHSYEVYFRKRIGLLFSIICFNLSRNANLICRQDNASRQLQPHNLRASFHLLSIRLLITYLLPRVSTLPIMQTFSDLDKTNFDNVLQLAYRSLGKDPAIVSRSINDRLQRVLDTFVEDNKAATIGTK